MYPVQSFSYPKVRGAALVNAELSIWPVTLSLFRLNGFLKNTAYSCSGRSREVLLERIPLPYFLLSVHHTTFLEMNPTNSLLWCLPTPLFVSVCDSGWKKQQFLLMGTLSVKVSTWKWKVSLLHTPLWLQWLEIQRWLVDLPSLLHVSVFSWHCQPVLQVLSFHCELRILYHCLCWWLPLFSIPALCISSCFLSLWTFAEQNFSLECIFKLCCSSAPLHCICCSWGPQPFVAREDCRSFGLFVPGCSMGSMYGVHPLFAYYMAACSCLNVGRSALLTDLSDGHIV